MPIDLPHLTGQIPYDVEQAIERLRVHLETQETLVNEAHARLNAMPAPLTLAEIQKQLSPSGQYPLPSAALLNTAPAQTSQPVPPPADGIPSFLDIVTADHNARGIGPTSTPAQCFDFCRQVVADINASGRVPPGLICGLANAPPGGNVTYVCNGQTYRYQQVAFSNNHYFEILAEGFPGGSRAPDWVDQGFLAGVYRPTTPPGSPC